MKAAEGIKHALGKIKHTSWWKKTICELKSPQSRFRKLERTEVLLGKFERATDDHLMSRNQPLDMLGPHPGVCVLRRPQGHTLRTTAVSGRCVITGAVALVPGCLQNAPGTVLKRDCQRRAHKTTQWSMGRTEKCSFYYSFILILAHGLCNVYII